MIVRIEQKEEDTKIIGLVTIYDKSEFENISDSQILKLILELQEEINDTEIE